MKSKVLQELNRPDGERFLDLFNVLRALEAFRRPLTVDEVASLLGESPDTIYRMVRSHQIPCFRPRGEWKFDPSALALWLSKKDGTLAVAARCQFRAA